jgi:methanogenic corrinoid protein MtbC1/DNA-binding transcriptional ArsR family regulator
MEKRSMENTQLPARDRIFRHLRQNRGKEVPISDVMSKLGLKRTTISNAIKELNLQGLIEIERRPLKRGRYTVIYLTGDLITERYVHKNEIIKEEKPSPKKKKDEVPLLSDVNFEEMITYLKSPSYNPDEFLGSIESMFPEIILFITDFVTPLMHEVGLQWARTSLSTAEEHVISNRIEQLIVARIPTNGDNGEKGTIILVPVEGERHVISLLSLELVLRSLNYKVINLGRALPIRSLIQYIKDLPEIPDWIFMSITLPAYLGTLKRNVEYLHSIFNNQIHIAIGGQGIKENDRNNFPEADVVAINKSDLMKFISQLD